MAIVLKIKCDTELYRVLLEEDKVSFEGIQLIIQNTCPSKTCIVKYRDEDNDLCTLCPSSFVDFQSHASEHNGKIVMKLELFEVMERCSDNAPATNLQEGHFVKQKTLASLWQNGWDKFKDFPKHGLTNLGQGHHWETNHMQALKSLKFIVAQLHKNGLLNATSIAALLMNSLPQMMTLLLEDAERMNRKLGRKLPQMQQFLEELQTLVARTEGMEHCAEIVANWREQTISPSDACLHLLPALSMLPPTSQVQFLETMYAKVEQGVQAKLTKLEHKFCFMPTVPMVHEGITCDMCSLSPIQGLRFKCKACPNYDLCAACYTQKDAFHAGECSAHEFETISFPSCPGFGNLRSLLKGWGKGKSKGKGEGKGKGIFPSCHDFGKLGPGKGKGKGKGKHMFNGKRKWCSDEDSQGTQPLIRPCGREGCTYAATWHPTHCCAACAHMGVHGGRCDKQDFAALEAGHGERSGNFCHEGHEVSPMAFPMHNAEKTHAEGHLDFEMVESTSVESLGVIAGENRNRDDIDAELRTVATHLEEMGLGSA